jgi:hypothetical protein
MVWVGSLSGDHLRGMWDEGDSAIGMLSISPRYHGLISNWYTRSTRSRLLFVLAHSPETCVRLCHTASLRLQDRVHGINNVGSYGATLLLSNQLAWELL